MTLTEIQELNLDEIEEIMSIVAAGHRMDTIGEEMQFLCQAFEARGSGHLLLDFDIDGFFQNLQRSAHARRFFLRKSREQGSTDPVFQALSRTDALFDCIAGGDWSLAKDILDLSPLSWMPEGEYEEDYCYHSLVHAYLAGLRGTGDPETAQLWLSRLEVIVAQIKASDIDVARLELCSHFLGGDEAAFWRAFETLVGVSGDIAAAVPLADGRVFEYPWVAAERHVSIELLAWMALARARGLRPPQREYNRCPSVAWINGRVERDPDLFLELEPLIGLDEGEGQSDESDEER
jgi:hypothetical protein